MKKLLKITFTLIFTIILLLGFAMPLNQVGNWYQQFMPSIGSRSIQDIFFLDSLTGWAVTNATNQVNDTIFILKTTNSGDNWVIQYRKIQTGGGFSGYFKVYFLNQNTGYTCDVLGVYKTTNGGSNWVSLNAPVTAYLDMSVLNTDTIWIVTPDSFGGGVFRTSNGGASWDQQFSGGSQNPNKIYMYNARIGYMSKNGGAPNIYKTVNSGLNWNVEVSGHYIRDMFFTDSLTGWYSYLANVYKTTNGGSNWITQILPTGGNIITTGINEFSNLNSDTIWGVGGEIIVGSQSRGIIYRTINGGQNWTFQIPDTAIYVPGPYNYIQFVNSKFGWAYTLGFYGGIHTTNGGDPVWLTGIEQISNEIPIEFKLYQNYPNPFNPVTNIKYSVKRETSNVKLIIFDVTGREIITLVNAEQQAGTYEVDWNAAGYSSGIYFYSLITDGILIETKKMLMVK